MIHNVLVVFYNNKYIFDFSDFLLPQTPGATYMIHMTNSLNYCIFFFFFCCCLFMTKSLLFYDQIISFLMWCILRLSRVNNYYCCSPLNRARWGGGCENNSLNALISAQCYFYIKEYVCAFKPCRSKKKITIILCSELYSFQIT